MAGEVGSDERSARAHAAAGVRESFVPLRVHRYVASRAERIGRSNGNLDDEPETCRAETIVISGATAFNTANKSFSPADKKRQTNRQLEGNGRKIGWQARS
ncbi:MULTISPECIES: hypothetical protein [Paraburkholderia]|uniref:hypothetical protein n=1 Tax=Paraburkholderia TaxID=1822464 RepID=UPI001C37CE3F|nr:hypothetical protein [Paraburkholderia youngii]